MELDLHTKQQLAELLAKPEMVTQAHAVMLASLASTFPYYQPLHLLLAKASANEINYKSNLATAALYNSGSILHQVIFEPKKLAVIENLNVVAFENNVTPKIEVKNHKTEQLTEDQQETFEEIAEAQNTSEQVSTVEKVEDEQEVFEEITEVAHSQTEEIVQQEISAEDTDQTFIAEPAFIETYNFREESEAVAPESTDESEKQQAIDEQETFEEISELDASLLTPTLDSPISNAVNKEEAEIDELELENIVSADFFAFEKSFTAENTTEIPETPVASFVEPEEYNQEAEAQSTVSKYDDDKLPYTFLWWLAKTRKDHEQIFQPYVTHKKHKNPSELQQQYVEHIFHIQTPFNVAEETVKGPLNHQLAPKGIELIDSFIKNDPQIRALKPDQINNENKAKKSAEDHNDLVSETLATIYIEQMLYHKAIDTYEKLSLKFPEKSRYFADLIQSLEKKI